MLCSMSSWQYRQVFRIKELQTMDLQNRAQRDKLAQRLIALKAAGSRLREGLVSFADPAGFEFADAVQEKADAEYLAYLAGCMDPRD